jgi:hypothetical protein
LTWTSSGNYTGNDTCQSLRVTVFDPAGQKEARGVLGASGALTPVR